MTCRKKVSRGIQGVPRRYNCGASAWKARDQSVDCSFTQSQKTGQTANLYPYEIAKLRYCEASRERRRGRRRRMAKERLSQNARDSPSTLWGRGC